MHPLSLCCGLGVVVKIIAIFGRDVPLLLVSIMLKSAKNGRSVADYNSGESAGIVSPMMYTWADNAE
jgi:hypothetical protein